jgi:hypothetical protein
MSDDPTPPTPFVALEFRLQALEAAVASLGAPSITHTHDGLAKFREWLASFVARV